MSALPVALIPTLGKQIPRLASNHDGEAVGTVRAIERVLKSGCRELHDLAACLGAPANQHSDKSDAFYRGLITAEIFNRITQSHQTMFLSIAGIAA
jgi:hypothetical protein